MSEDTTEQGTTSEEATSAEVVTDAPESESTPAPAPAPRPGPRPGGPRPGAPRPGAPAARPATAAPTSDPSAFGRVDEDGGVWLRTTEGERQVGSWQAGEPAEGLAHFGRRFDDLATEVTILEKRLASGGGDARQTQESARTLLDGLPTAAVVGDVATLGTRLEAVLAATEVAAAAAKEQKEAARAEQAAHKEALAVEAEQLGTESTQWKAAGDRLREILEEWKTIRGIDRKTDDALWKRYSKAREAFNRRRGAHFADLDRERAVARTRKDELVAQAEALSTSTDFGATAGQFRDLMAEWKAAGRAPREADDALWAQFKDAQDRFFAARNAAAGERDAEFGANGEAKQALLAEAETIDPARGLDQAKAALRSVQERWDAVGKVPRELVQALEARMRTVEDTVRGADEARWTRTDPEAEARAAQFRERVRAFEEQAAKARAAGKEKRALEAEAQAAQWREWADAAEGAVGGA
ncbi:DUF349 domain-containing protein [Rhodococcus antarcticus]|jgi:hypothetical protein|uniref:DUF349 domain-containing protein n=1 Tax=Rhodococcus antarcticus TaxID=2987751 RepID=A0ABY6P446_9NOCA|nr:DUF349 domain-containing protein [Rhodococcus antarcticus]UZJ25853.1 DUF349 domain-containing protein [Rhodococcus antarcticus]